MYIENVTFIRVVAKPVLVVSSKSRVETYFEQNVLQLISVGYTLDLFASGSMLLNKSENIRDIDFTSKCIQSQLKSLYFINTFVVNHWT